MSDLELREKVATLVMGWRKQKVGILHEGVMFQRAASYPTPLDMLPAYESDIAAAWLVVEAMAEWAVANGKACWMEPYGVNELTHMKAERAAEYICLAAKAAIEATQ